MRIKEGFVVREVAGQAMAIATGEASKDFRGMIRLNGTGKIIWTGLQDGLSEEEIVGKILDEYQVEPERARRDVKEFIAEMTEKGFLADE